jgi:TonB family protein
MRLVASAVAVIVYLMVVVGATADAEPDGHSFEWAQSNLDKDPQAAVATLDRLARAGDLRSQMRLGALLLDGKVVSQDKPLGLAFLQVAAVNDEPISGGVMSDKWRELVRQYALQMSGTELIRADQLTNAIIAEEIQAEIGPYTDQKAAAPMRGPFSIVVFENDPVHINVPPKVAPGQSVRLGCAAESGEGCSGEPVSGAPGHCTGTIPIADAPTTTGAFGSSLQRTPTIPKYPPWYRRHGISAAVRLAAHVDSSGWVCSAIVTSTSGYKDLDESALEAVRQWQYLPATKAGLPVEKLVHFQITFRLVP